MMKLIPTLMGHTTVKLRIFLHIPSTRDLGKCTEMISDNNISFNKVWNILENIWLGFRSLGENGENWAILAWWGPAQWRMLKQCTKSNNFIYEYFSRNMGFLLTQINFWNRIWVKRPLIMKETLRLANFNKLSS